MGGTKRVEIQACREMLEIPWVILRLSLGHRGRGTAIEGVTFRNNLEHDGTVKLFSVHLRHFFT